MQSRTMFFASCRGVGSMMGETHPCVRERTQSQTICSNSPRSSHGNWQTTFWATLQLGMEDRIRDGTTLGLRGAMPPPPSQAFGKKFPIIYISIKNLLLTLKLIYLAPLSQTIYKLTHETKNEKNYQIIHCLVVPRISRKTFS